jgi:hypothetical protein
MTGIKAKHCRGFWGRRGKDDRKQYTLAPLAEGHRELKRRKERSSSDLTVVHKEKNYTAITQTQQRSCVTIVCFLVPLPTKPLPHHMDRQARTSDTVLVKSREMTGRSQTLPRWLGKGGEKTTENKRGPQRIEEE